MPGTMIFGATGLLGSNWIRFRSDQSTMIACTHSKVINAPNLISVAVDFKNPAWSSSLEQYSPDLIVNAVGYTDVAGCEENPQRAMWENYEIARKISDFAMQHKVKLVHISTDHLFRGDCLEKYSELSKPEPVNVYAQSKLAGEDYIRSTNPGALIVRTNFFGWGHQFRRSFSDWVYESLKHNKVISMYHDVFFTPIYVKDLIESIETLLRHNQSGVFNIVGSEQISKYDFALKLAKVFDFDPALINRASYGDGNKNSVERPRNMALSSDKISQVTHQKTKDVNQSLVSLREDLFEVRQNDVAIAGELIPYGRHFIDEDDIAAVADLLRHGDLTQGPMVEEFEQRVADFVGAKYAVAVSSWTAGLHIACMAFDLGEGDYVITSPNSFVASANCAVYVGATPVFADIDPNTLNIDPDHVERLCKKYEGKVKAIIPVHFSGYPCDMVALTRIAKTYGAKLLEDGAQAFGARYKTGEMVGSGVYSDLVGFSFHPVKGIACGEGGLITTNDVAMAARLKVLRSHGINRDPGRFQHESMAFSDGRPHPWYYEMETLGFNYRITDIQCALGVSQLKKMQRFAERRLMVAKAYDAAFAELPNVKIVHLGDREISSNHLYIVEIDFSELGVSRHEFFNQLKERGIRGQVHYIPIPDHPYYKANFPTPAEQYRHASTYYERAVTLPLFASMTDAQVATVIRVITELVKR